MENDIQPGDVVALKAQTSQHITVGVIDGKIAVCYYFEITKREFISTRIPLVALVKLAR